MVQRYGNTLAKLGKICAFLQENAFLELDKWQTMSLDHEQFSIRQDVSDNDDAAQAGDFFRRPFQWRVVD